MKRIHAVVIFLAVASAALAFDVPVRWPDGRIREGYPARIGAVVNPSSETCASNGYAPASPAEVEAQEQADALAKAEAAAQAAQYADPQPAVFVPRVAGTITNIVGQSQVFVDGETGEVFALDETGSPEKTLAQKQAQNAARKVKVAAAKTAKAKGNGLNALAERVAALEALNGIE